MCPTHWQGVPAKLRRALRQAWRGGRDTGTRAYRAGARACIRAADANRQPAGDQHLRRQARRFLAGYRHPNHTDRDSWDDEDMTRLVRVIGCHPHKPDPAPAAACAGRDPGRMTPNQPNHPSNDQGDADARHRHHHPVGQPHA